MQYAVIIPGAGSSSRFQKDKLTFKINNQYLIHHTVSNFLDDNECQKIILLVNKSKYDFYKNLYCLQNKILVIGVATSSRHETVKIGLQYCAKNEYVLIHDACRPYVTQNLIEIVKSKLKDGYDAVCPVVDIVDSVIDINNNQIQYLERNNIKRVQTPEGFKVSVLMNAFGDAQSSNEIFNDEFSLVLSGQAKIKHLLVPGEVGNTKITVPEDVSVIDYDLND